MKKLFILLTSIFAVSMLAMAQLKLYVHQNDGSYTEFIAAAVDSITFSEQTPEKDVANGYDYVDLGYTLHFYRLSNNKILSTLCTNLDGNYVSFSITKKDCNPITVEVIPFFVICFTYDHSRFIPESI